MPPESDFDGDCYADGLVAGLGGADEIESRYGLTADSVMRGETIGAYELDTVTALSLTKLLIPCADPLDVLFGFDPRLQDANVRACMRSELSDDLLRRWYTEGFMSTDEEPLVSPSEQMDVVIPGAAATCGYQ